MKITLSLSILLITALTFAQDSKKYYLDSELKTVRSKKKASFYEIREGQGTRNSFIGKSTLYTLEDKLVHYEFLYKGKRDGTFVSFDPKNGAKTIGNFKKGKRTGTWYKTDFQGNIISSFEYNKEGEIENKVDFESNDSIFYALTNLPPEYAQGSSAWNSYLRKSLRYPSEMARGGFSGKIEIHYLISESGQIIDSYIVKSPHPQISDHITKLVKESGEWRGAIKAGKTVNSIYVYLSSYNFLDLRN
ncbi:hypothetical protein BFP97_07020 [Roseivirga sp. 4D4]|uniref:energy transducer TonB n=1 Tax=Roseivirga sp. 4D4 TaxID=1889784 RepID=UPI000852CF9F|nr:energy transducer TonB [Roseivirga sp. 4D4]OEK01278.1 hypothetical protein BFP97_07020 [Roseivirga sp. 4D4]